MEKVHLHFALVISGLIGLVSIVLFTIDKPMTNFMGMMLFAVALMCGSLSYLDYKLRQDNQPH